MKRYLEGFFSKFIDNSTLWTVDNDSLVIALSIVFLAKTIEECFLLWFNKK